MQIKEEYRGNQKTVYSVVTDNERCPAIDFLKDLKRRDQSAHREMVRRYKRHGDNGPSPIQKHERHIKNRGNLWEFKASQGYRLLYFNHPNGGIVLANGFRKGDPPEVQFDRAEGYRDDILT